MCVLRNNTKAVGRERASKTLVLGHRRPWCGTYCRSLRLWRSPRAVGKCGSFIFELRTRQKKGRCCSGLFGISRPTRDECPAATGGRRRLAVAAGGLVRCLGRAVGRAASGAFTRSTARAGRAVGSRAPAEDESASCASGCREGWGADADVGRCSVCAVAYVQLSQVHGLGDEVRLVHLARRRGQEVHDGLL